MPEHLYNDLNSFLRARFGCRVQRITIDAGLTCPNRDGTVGRGGCIYCNARGSGTGASAHASITEQISSAKPFLHRRYGAEKFIAYFQSFSNTYAPVETLRAMYEEALGSGDIVGLATGTRPDCAGEEVLDLLAGMNRKTWITVEYGLQSIHDRTLELINRGHTAAAFRDAVERTRERGIDICVHVILGLPGETKDDMLATARAVAAMNIQGIKLHLLYVVRDTPLHDMYEKGLYQCLTRDEYIDILCGFLALLPPDMVIHRLTGDPHRNELVAPLWALEKTANLKAIRDTLINRNLRQGILYGKARE
ncbi:TIGR01212 family radical SAM protein [bacterium]|nr:TIGR01212 family radical SAM protein [bacterium]